MKYFVKTLKSAFLASAVVSIAAGLAVEAKADLMEKAKSGEEIRIGFANEVPWAYPGENNEPLGFINVIAIDVLKKMGITNIKPVVTEWGGLIPGLKANRSDIITGGMYINAKRCAQATFSDPVGQFGDAFIVKKGNPKGLNNYQDVKAKGAVFVTGQGYNQVDFSKKQGLDPMVVPGPTEILAAVKAGRADAGGVTALTAAGLVKNNSDAIEMTDPAALPKETLNWAGIVFRNEDAAFVEMFNKALKAYLGSDEHLAAVAKYDYTKEMLPGDATTAFACSNR